METWWFPNIETSCFILYKNDVSNTIYVKTLIITTIKQILNTDVYIKYATTHYNLNL